MCEWCEERKRCLSCGKRLPEGGAPSSCTVDSIVGFVRSELADVTERIDRGKGDWPTSNYVRDETWALWRGERMALERVLHKIESNA